MVDIFDGLGFVPVDEIQSIFTHEATEIERDLRRNGVPANPKDILDYVDHIRATLIKRAKHNIDAYILAHPTIKKDAREAKVQTTTSDSRKTWEERRQKNVQKGYLNP